MDGPLLHGDITKKVIVAFYDAYTALGFGFVESVCAAAMERELKRVGLEVTREMAVQVIYKGEPIAFQRLDFVVDQKVVVELKASAVVPPYAERQLLNYLRATNLKVGLLLHFGPKPSFKRVTAFGRERGQPVRPG